MPEVGEVAGDAKGTAGASSGVNGALIAGRAVVVSDGLAGCICGRGFGGDSAFPPCERDNFGESAAVCEASRWGPKKLEFYSVVRGFALAAG